MKNIKLVIFLLWSFSIAYCNSDNLSEAKNDSSSNEIKKETIAPKTNLVGGRSRKSIESVVRANLYELTDAYNQRLRDGESVEGKLKVKFTIDEFGNVIESEVVEENLGDKILVDQCVRIIKKWKFEKIVKPGDQTQVVYPFAFNRSTKASNEDSVSKWRCLTPILIVISAVTTIFIAAVLLNQL
jgi:TonB family protein